MIAIQKRISISYVAATTSEMPSSTPDMLR